MGIYGIRFYFKQGLPKVSVVKEKFKAITGLSLSFISEINLKNIVEDRADIIEQLHKIENKSYPETPYFYCEDFNKAWIGEYSVEENSFAIEYGIKSPNLYFFDALIKTMHELGGLKFAFHEYPCPKDLNIDAHLEPYNPHEREWKKIKKWADMSDLEKSTFDSKYK
jgi:hypothetical protein